MAFPFLVPMDVYVNFFAVFKMSALTFSHRSARRCFILVWWNIVKARWSNFLFTVFTSRNNSCVYVFCISNGISAAFARWTSHVITSVLPDGAPIPLVCLTLGEAGCSGSDRALGDVCWDSTERSLSAVGCEQWLLMRLGQHWGQERIPVRRWTRKHWCCWLCGSSPGPHIPTAG